nr:hypothetical protein CFP56_77154 [Quercus suber]
MHADAHFSQPPSLMTTLDVSHGTNTGASVGLHAAYVQSLPARQQSATLESRPYGAASTGKEPLSFATTGLFAA